jgi:hypothetical protein
MKRLSPRARLRNFRIAKWSLEKRIERRGYGRDYGDVVRRQNVDLARDERFSRKTPGYECALSGRLDFQNNAMETIRQLRALMDLADHRGRPFRGKIILDDVTYIDAPSLLFLCSRIEELQSAGGRIWGSYPSDADAKKALLDADFPGFLWGRTPSFDKSTRTLQLHRGSSGEAVNIQVARSIKSFLSNLAPALSVEEVDHIYLAAMECLENVRIHAYDPKRGGSWYAVGLFDPVSDSATIAILDLGVGMRKTVEKQLSLLSKIVGAVTQSTAELIREATLGRTASQQAHRGKGLSRLREFAVGAGGALFSVYSGDGMVVWGKGNDGSAHDVPHMVGTIVSLRVSATQSSTIPAGA